jgi:hypothetical protein
MPMRRAGFLFVLLLVSAEALGQGVQTGTLRGIVRDQQGLAVPGVTVIATSTALQGRRTTVTSPLGAYTLRLLPAGDYDIAFDRTGFSPVSRKTTIPLGLTVEQRVTLRPAGVAETVAAVEEIPAPITTPVVGANFTHDEIEALAMSRTLAGIAELSPGLTNITPDRDQVSINGAFAFDNVFLIDGVDISDNLFGSPQNLFIEDAIQETQTLTSGIGAEFGRFTGGVVNAITRSGSNHFGGSVRLNLTNPAWSTQTPFELCGPRCPAAATYTPVAHEDVLNKTWEGTVGGPVIRDRLWFYAAGRKETLATSSSFPETNIANTETDRNQRGDIKLTATVTSSHTIQGGYVSNSSEQAGRPSFSSSIDPFTAGDPRFPNSSYFTTYHGLLKDNLLVEAQYSQRTFQFVNVGGSSTSIVESPFFTLGSGRHYNAPYFDVTDPESRNNHQLAGAVTYFFQASGRHEVKGGYEFFRSQLTGGSSQSPTGYVFDSDYLTAGGGRPVYDSSNHLIPLFVPGDSQIEHWFPDRGAVLNVDTNSFYAQDYWAINDRVSADLGLRYERVRSEATGNLTGVDTGTIVPRLALGWDIRGNGKQIAHVTYSHYSGSYNEAQIGGNNHVGNPDVLFGIYAGPRGQGRSFAPGFNPANYVIVDGRFPTANVSMAPGLSSPVTKEFTLSYGSEVGRRGYAEATYVMRRTGNLIEDLITLANGTTRVVKNGFDLGTFTNVIYDNTDLASREYDGLLLQSRYSVNARWSVNGHYTLMLKNEGNYEGEAANQPGLVSPLGDFPEGFNAARNFPSGRLQDFQRHKLRLWSVYSLSLGRAGRASVSGLWRLQSGEVYSLKAINQALTATQLALLARYSNIPTSQTVYFGARGSQDFLGYGLVDASVNYDVPVVRSLRPWLKFDVFNLLDNLKQVKWNTTVRRDAASTRDSLGLATGYTLAPSYGQAEANTDFPTPVAGVVGGRTFRVSFGVRF